MGCVHVCCGWLGWACCGLLRLLHVEVYFSGLDHVLVDERAYRDKKNQAPGESPVAGFPEDCGLCIESGLCIERLPNLPSVAILHPCLAT